MSASLYQAWSAGQLPLKRVLGTPDECIAAALRMAEQAERLGDLELAETLLRGVCALDAQLAIAAEALGRVLLTKALSGERKVQVLADAHAWLTYAAQLDPHSASIDALVRRCALVR